MALEEYRRKRDFNRTPEPAGRTRAKRGKGLSFVVQKHAARRLHYDFRLELGGVLLSWAVPKGPSLDPGEKRLAVHVEDHPIEYGGFEGVIPPDQYGSGTVMLWDRGTWEPLDKDPAEALRKGMLKFRLDGEKLHGAWVLVRMGGKAAKERHENWLLIKERDEVAQPGSGEALVAEHPTSVESGRDMDEIANEADRVWDGRHGEVAADPKRERALAKVAGAERVAMPKSVRPLLASPVDVPPQGADWLHEIKLDGYRILARIAGRQAVLISRNGNDWTAKFPELAAALARLPVKQAIVDGEVVALESAGRSSFAALQQALSDRRTGDLVYFAFDLLYLDGSDLRGALLTERKRLLRGLVEGAGAAIRYCDHQAGQGPAFFRQACEFALEGIVSKRADSPYQSGRSRLWVKVKCGNREELAVIGFTDPTGARIGFGALVLGYFDKGGKLHYAGRVGTGFNDKLLKELRRRLERSALARKPAGLAIPKGTPANDVHWVKPALVADIRFAGWTRDGVVRQAAFLGLREDKGAEQIVLDPRHAVTQPAAQPTSKVARNGLADVAGQRLTNPERVLYPEAGISKLDLAHYYAAIADWALPHLTGRVLSLLRCPEGHTAQCFFQKHGGSGLPEAIRRTEIAEKDGPESALYITDTAGLIGLVQMGVLEIHPWGSRLADLERPDRLTFDLDPDEGLPWERVVEAALVTRAALQTLGLESFPKTTGGKGLHVVMPLTPSLDWDEAKAFAKAVAEHITAAAPDRYIAQMAKRARRGKVFIDYLRNGRGATAVGAFSTRAKPGATVSAPLAWREVEAGIRSDQFAVATLPERLKRLRGDPWEGFFDVKQKVSAAARRKLKF